MRMLSVFCVMCLFPLVAGLNIAALAHILPKATTILENLAVPLRYHRDQSPPSYEKETSDTSQQSNYMTLGAPNSDSSIVKSKKTVLVQSLGNLRIGSEILLSLQSSDKFTISLFSPLSTTIPLKITGDVVSDVISFNSHVGRKWDWVERRHFPFQQVGRVTIHIIITTSGFQVTIGGWSKLYEHRTEFTDCKTVSVSGDAVIHNFELFHPEEEHDVVQHDSVEESGDLGLYDEQTRSEEGSEEYQYE